MILDDHVQSLKNLRKWHVLKKTCKFNNEGDIIMPDETKKQKT